MSWLKNLFTTREQRLDTAIMLGDVETVNKLLAGGADKHGKNKEGETHLHRAAMGGYPDVVKALISGGANTQARTKAGRTPLHYVASGRYVKDRLEQEGGLAAVISLTMNHGAVASILIEHGADVHAATETGRVTPLHVAAEEGQLAVVEVLLGAAASPDKTDSGEETPLHSAARAGHAAVIQKLIGAHADVRAQNAKGMTPVKLAVSKGAADAAQVLLRECVDDLQSADSSGKTLLHTAAMFGFPSVAEVLIRHGARLDAVSDDGNTPLHWAVLGSFLNEDRHNSDKASGYVSVVGILLRSGADPTIRNAKGRTAWGEAQDPFLLERMAGYRAVADLLRKEGADRP